MKPMAINALDAIEMLTVTVKVRNVWRLRLGLFVLGLAARILDCGLNISKPEE